MQEKEDKTQWPGGKMTFEDDFDAFLNECVTIVGMGHYYGGNIVDRGVYLRCHKEPDNEKDHEAIYVALPVIGKVGYIANNTFTVIKGTQSAGRIYDKVADVFFVKVLFQDSGKAVAKILRTDIESLNEQWKEQFFNPDLVKSH